MSLLLVMVVSSGMFWLSSAIATTSSLLTVTEENFDDEVIKSSKPVIVILVSKYYLESEHATYLSYSKYLEDTKAKAENLLGDKYKIVTGLIQENLSASSHYFPVEILTNQNYPSFFIILVYANGKPIIGHLASVVHTIPVLESLKDDLLEKDLINTTEKSKNTR